MKHTYLFLLMVSLLGLIGCGDARKSEADKVAEAARKSFDAAPEEIKSRYLALKSALDGNDLPKAIESFGKLTKAELTAQQQMALAELKRNLVLKASTAAQNGDAAAARFLQDVRSQSRSR